MPTLFQNLIPLVTRIRWCAGGLKGNDTWHCLAYRVISSPLSYLVFPHPEKWAEKIGLSRVKDLTKSHQNFTAGPGLKLAPL